MPPGFRCRNVNADYRDMPPMPSIVVKAYAKINLTLDVFNMRADGFHSLASIMQAISLHDVIEIERAEIAGVCLTCQGEHAADVPSDSSNLVVRAARAVMEVAHCEAGLNIRLHKSIPSQAGLGGGSSDAAATLLGVTALFGFDIGPKLLHELAARLGSDVPFFLSAGTAVVRGRGENINPIADAPTFWIVIVKPEDNVSTAWAYNQLDALEDRRSNRATKNLEDAIKTGDRARVVSGQSNDFEVPVFHHFPKLAWIRDELQMAGALGAHLCGSGSALYGVAGDERAARKIAHLIGLRYPHTCVARTLSRIESNPLRESAL